MNVRVGLYRKLSTEELILLNCGVQNSVLEKLLNCGVQKSVLEKTLESPLDCKEIQPVNPKGNQP